MQTLFLPALWEAFRTRIIRRKFVRDVGILTVANFVGAALSVVQGIPVARWLGPELYGVTALVMSYPSIVYNFFDARSVEASVKYLSEFHARNERDRILAMCKLGYMVDFAIASIAFLVVLVTAPWAARSIAHRPEAVGLIIIYAAAFVPRALTGTSCAVLVTLGRFPIIAWVDTLVAFFRAALVLGLILTGWQVAGVVWGNAIATMATGLIYGCIAGMLMQRTWGASPLHSGWRAFKGCRREIFGFLAYNDLNALLDMIPRYLDVVMLGYFRNPTEVGYYKLAKTLAGALANLTSPLQSVTYSKLARLWGAGLLGDFHRAVYTLATAIGVPLLSIILLGFFFVPSLLLYLLGEPYVMASSATQLLLVVTGLRLAGFWVRPFYLATGQIRLLTAFALIGAVAAIPTYTGCIWLWGFKGLAASRIGLAIVTDVAAGVMVILYGLREGHGVLSASPWNSARKIENHR